MKCTICKNEDVPVSDGQYLSNYQIPILQGGERAGRIRIAYPSGSPLCNKCRRDLVVGGLINESITIITKQQAQWIIAIVKNVMLLDEPTPLPCSQDEAKQLLEDLGQ